MADTFQVGDRVTRPTDVYKDGSPLKHGRVCRRYEHTSKFLGIHYPELYGVIWDDETEEKGFLPHGLDHEEEVVGTTHRETETAAQST